MSKGKLVVISGASGVGKGTVLGIMMNKRKDLAFSVSATTRPPRPNEVDGVHYYFITKEQFEDMISKGEFLLLCSDGLSTVLDDQEILFEVIHGVDKRDCCQRLLEIAKGRGAPDNVTSVLIAV